MDWKGAGGWGGGGGDFLTFKGDLKDENTHRDIAFSIPSVA